MDAVPTVYVVDDDAAVLQSVALLTRSMGWQCREYSSGRAFLDAYDAAHSGCVVLDVRMPDVGGLEVQESLAAYEVPPPVLILTGHADVPTALSATRLGAVEFLEKDFRENELLAGIQRALAIDRLNRGRQARRCELAARMALLTPAEREVLELVFLGEPNKTIAARVGVSRRCVEDRRASLMAKLSAESLSELIRLVCELETLDSPNRACAS